MNAAEYASFVKTNCSPPPIVRQRPIPMQAGRPLRVPGKPALKRPARRAQPLPASPLDALPPYVEEAAPPAPRRLAGKAGPPFTPPALAQFFTPPALALMREHGLPPEFVTKQYPNERKITKGHVSTIVASMQTSKSPRKTRRH